MSERLGLGAVCPPGRTHIGMTERIADADVCRPVTNYPST